MQDSQPLDRKGASYQAVLGVVVPAFLMNEHSGAIETVWGYTPGHYA